MVKVFFEGKTHAQLVAIFEDETLYAKAANRLEKIAIKEGYEKITESVTSDYFEDHISLDEYRLFTEWRKKEIF